MEDLIKWQPDFYLHRHPKMVSYLLNIYCMCFKEYNYMLRNNKTSAHEMVSCTWNIRDQCVYRLSKLLNTSTWLHLQIPTSILFSIHYIPWSCKYFTLMYRTVLSSLFQINISKICKKHFGADIKDGRIIHYALNMNTYYRTSLQS